MNPNLHKLLPACFKRSTNSLRWIGLICFGIFSLVFLAALASSFAQPEFNAGIGLGLGILLACMAGSYAIYWQAQRVHKRLNELFFESPESVEMVEARIITLGPMPTYIIHFHPKKPAKFVGLNVPNLATFNALRELLPQHFPNAKRVGMH